MLKIHRLRREGRSVDRRVGRALIVEKAIVSRGVIALTVRMRALTNASRDNFLLQRLLSRNMFVFIRSPSLSIATIPKCSTSLLSCYWKPVVCTVVPASQAMLRKNVWLLLRLLVTRLNTDILFGHEFFVVLART